MFRPPIAVQRLRWQLASNPPVDQRKGITELLDTLKIRHVAGCELKAIVDGEGRDHGVRHADRLSDSLQIAGDAAGKFSSRLVEEKDFHMGEGGEESVETASRLRLLEAIDDLHHRDGGKRVMAERPAVGLRVGSNGGVLRLADL
jgi:hypothetical protein